jgi:hypothetical protein
VSLEHTGLYREMAEGPQPSTPDRTASPEGERTDRIRMRLPDWRCHKVVAAGRIEDIAPRTGHQRVLVVCGHRDLPVAVVVPESYIERNKPVRGGYYVLYEDGYESFSPRQAFESGYRRIGLPGVDIPALAAAAGMMAAKHAEIGKVGSPSAPSDEERVSGAGTMGTAPQFPQFFGFSVPDHLDEWSAVLAAREKAGSPLGASSSAVVPEHAGIGALQTPGSPIRFRMEAEVDGTSRKVEVHVSGVDWAAAEPDEFWARYLLPALHQLRGASAAASRGAGVGAPR